MPLQTAIDVGHRSIEYFGRITQACSRDEGAMIEGNAQALKASEPLPALMAAMMGQNQRTPASWDETHCSDVLRRLAQSRVAVMPSLMVSDFYLGKDPKPDEPKMRSVPIAIGSALGPEVGRERLACRCPAQSMKPMVVSASPIEGEQQTAADFGSVVDRLQAGRMGGPAVVAEVAMAGPGREHQNVIGNVSAVHDDVFALTINACDCAQQHACVALAPDQATNRSSDVGRRQPGGRHLIEQRLKEVMVLPVDQGDVRRRFGKPLRDSEAGEASAHDDHARALTLHVAAAVGHGRAHRATDALNSAA